MKKATDSNRKIYWLLGLILGFGLLLRLTGINWDQGLYLNPDERFLVMTATNLKWPSHLWQYFDPQTSPLNPYNNKVNFFVYGHFPLNFAKFWASFFNRDNYNQFFTVARPLVAIIDWSVILAVYLLAQQIFFKSRQKNLIALMSSLSYTLMIFPLQQAHFFTTDSFVNAFFIWSLYFLIKQPQQINNIIASAFFFGLGFASKISIVYTLPLLMIILITNHFSQLKKTGVSLFIFILVSYLTVRLADPYIFNSGNFFNPVPNEQFVQNIKELSFYGKTVFYPPGLQWVKTDWTLPFRNLVFYGLGSTLFLSAIIGLTKLFLNRNQLDPITKRVLLCLFLWILFFFIWQANQISKTMRYFLFLYPLLAIFSGFALINIPKIFRSLVLLPSLLWLLMFIHIYSVPHSRNQASVWLNTNVAKNSLIVTEYWDDPLPLYPLPEKNLRVVQIDLYEPDTQFKWQRLAKIIGRSHYLVLSSNRLWASIPRVPELYPLTSRYYSFLFENKLGFHKIKEFSSFPTLNLGFTKLVFNDSKAEEAFTVYDHPQIMIFKRSNFNEKQFLKLINGR